MREDGSSKRLSLEESRDVALVVVHVLEFFQSYYMYCLRVKILTLETIGYSLDILC